MRVIILYDNNAQTGFESGWGFSCLLDHTQRILFDTGDDGRKLINNFGKASIDPSTVNKVVLSHNHWDHIDGLKGFQKFNSEAEVIHPDGFSAPTEISPGIFSTGALGGNPKEQSLVVKTKKGNIVVTGCAHPGLERILQTAKKLGPVYGVLGGFHGFSKFAELEGIRLIAPCHCTQHTEQIRQEYPNQFKQIMAGSILEI
ncbi:MAG: MBL fold metallo-hydrolase [Sedimentisphaerales bacterium]|nr:MBL fold metallo-hydrolase [Sedimentisphaerales bacterium]